MATNWRITPLTGLLLAAYFIPTWAAIAYRIVMSPIDTGVAADKHWSKIARLHPLLTVTLSIGVAASHEGDTQDEVLALADKRLYHAKRLGRDRVEAA